MKIKTCKGCNSITCPLSSKFIKSPGKDYYWWGGRGGFSSRWIKYGELPPDQKSIKQ